MTARPRTGNTDVTSTVAGQRQRVDPRARSGGALPQAHRQAVSAGGAKDDHGLATAAPVQVLVTARRISHRSEGFGPVVIGPPLTPVAKFANLCLKLVQAGLGRRHDAGLSGGLIKGVGFSVLYGRGLELIHEAD
jgi:hypothetical protein